jgi:hypothetical protein
MKIHLSGALSLLFFFGFSGIIRAESGKEIVKQMYERYHTKWYHSLQYTQKTEYFKKGKFDGTQIWYLKFIFPDIARTDYIDPKRRNTDIITNDTLWEFRKELVRNIIPGVGDPLFLNGGLYFKTLDEDYTEFQNMGIDLGKARSIKSHGRTLFVIGSDSAGQEVNQVWVDAQDMYITKVIFYLGKLKYEQILENQVKVGGGWSETKASVYIDGGLATVQTYSDLRFDNLQLSGAFDPRRFLDTRTEN